jgi:hypothetical protein
MIIVYYDNVKHEIANSDEIIYYKLHRAGDLPSLILQDGTRYWYKNGQLHRDEDKPAVISNEGSKHWFKNNLRHREGNKPAVIWYDNDQWWYKHNKRYRRFKLQDLFFLQMCIKIFFHFKRNKFIWSPKYLGGKFTKKQLLAMLLPKVALP